MLSLLDSVCYMYYLEFAFFIGNFKKFSQVLQKRSLAQFSWSEKYEGALEQLLPLCRGSTIAK